MFCFCGGRKISTSPSFYTWTSPRNQWFKDPCKLLTKPNKILSPREDRPCRNRTVDDILIAYSDKLHLRARFHIKPFFSLQSQRVTRGTWNVRTMFQPRKSAITVGIRLSLAIMVAPLSVKTGPVECSVRSGSAIRSFRDSLFRRHCRERWRKGGSTAWVCCVCFLRCLLSSSCWLHFSYPFLTPSRTAKGLLLRSSASRSQLSGSMPASFRSRLQTALKRRTGRPTGRRPVASLPYTTSFGIRPSFIRQICPGLNVYDMHVPYDKHHEVSSELIGKKNW